MKPSKVLRLMRDHKIPRGSDDPALNELGAPPLHQVTEDEIEQEDDRP